MRRIVRRIGREDSGAVAPIVALSLFALIGSGGIAFDYARLASLDTELQNAADQAALAAASQLTGDGACARAARAAGAAVGGTDAMVVNRTLIANDAKAVDVTTDSDPGAGGEDELLCNATGNIRFWQDKDKSAPATTDAEAKFVEVQVNPRETFYALTPVVAAFSTGPRIAIAFASLGEAYCKVPPVMICNPQEFGTNLEFDFEGLDGVGLRLVSVGQGGGGWAPGNFGYLNMPGLANGAPGLREGLGWGIPPIDCIEATGLDTKPGATVSVTDAINTRFDIYDSNVSCPNPGSCPASINSVKDVRRPANANGGNACRMHSQGWQVGSGYYGSGTTPSVATSALADTVIPTAMGHPRDMCHSVVMTAAGACTRTDANGNLEWDPVGTGDWDRNAYFRTNYVRTSVGNEGEAIGTRWSQSDWEENLGDTSPRRYDVYLWEIANRGTVVDGVVVLGQQPTPASGNTLVSKGEPVCSAGQGYGAGTIPSDDTPDRRKITVAVVNCVDEGVNGNSTGVQTIGWLDAFLVEPSAQRDRTNTGDVYVEVIGATTQGVQLVSKKVPYLIE